ncbi:hypothetical protein [Aureibacillus halotolerans]|nr:hypothetical protein [Aureibacillus halotolerans]
MEFLILFLLIEVARAMIREACSFLIQWLKRSFMKKRHKKNRSQRRSKQKGGSKNR